MDYLHEAAASSLYLMFVALFPRPTKSNTFNFRSSELPPCRLYNPIKSNQFLIFEFKIESFVSSHACNKQIYKPNYSTISIIFKWLLQFFIHQNFELCAVPPFTHLTIFFLLLVLHCSALRNRLCESSGSIVENYNLCDKCELCAAMCFESSIFPALTNGRNCTIVSLSCERCAHRCFFSFFFFIAGCNLMCASSVSSKYV